MTKNVFPEGEKHAPANSEEYPIFSANLKYSPEGVTPTIKGCDISSQRYKSPSGAIVRLSQFFRIAVLFGSKNNEQLGFIETLNYTTPLETTWETSEGMVVPKYFQITITYRMIHNRVPSNKSEFYGFTGV